MISIIRKHFFDYIIGLLTLSTRNNKKSNNFTRKSTQNCLDGKKKKKLQLAPRSPGINCCLKLCIKFCCTHFLYNKGIELKHGITHHLFCFGFFFRVTDANVPTWRLLKHLNPNTSHENNLVNNYHIPLNLFLNLKLYFIYINKWYWPLEKSNVSLQISG